MKLYKPVPPKEEEIKDPHQLFMENLRYKIENFIFEYLKADCENGNQPYFEISKHETIEFKADDENKKRSYFDIFHHENVDPIKEKDLDAFIKSARQYRKLWDCTKDCAQVFIDKNLPVPKKLAEFIEFQNKHSKKRPKPPGKDPLEDLAFKRMILIALDYAVKQGLSLTRNDSSDSNSACDIVAWAIKNVIEIDIEYAGIRGIKDREFRTYSKISTHRKLNRFPR